MWTNDCEVKGDNHASSSKDGALVCTAHWPLLLGHNSAMTAKLRCQANSSLMQQELQAGLLKVLSQKIKSVEMPNI